MSDNFYKGFSDLENILSDYITKVDKPLEIMEIGAKEYVNDLKKLTKPYSQIRKSGYTHLIDTFSYRIKNRKIEIGWGKYYGLMVEDGTRKTKAQPHMYPTFQKNKEKYYKKMLNAFYR